MANFFSNKIVFVSENKEDIQELLDTFNALLESEKTSYRELFWNLNIDLDTQPNINFDRGWFNYCDDELNCDDNKTYYFYVESETAYNPHLDILNLLVKQFKDIRFYISTSEPINSIYINTDVEGKYFPIKALIEFYHPKYGTVFEYCFNEEECYRTLFKVLGKKFICLRKAKKFTRKYIRKNKNKGYTFICDIINFSQKYIN